MNEKRVADHYSIEKSIIYRSGSWGWSPEQGELCLVVLLTFFPCYSWEGGTTNGTYIDSQEGSAV